MATSPIALGNSDFRELQRAGAPYVDKTAWVRDVLLTGATVTLFCRPRRFGKTTALRTLECFAGRSGEDASDLFSGLEVWQSEEARAHFGRYPVLFLSFKGVRSPTWDGAWGDICGIVARACDRHPELAGSSSLEPHERQRFCHLRAGTASGADVRKSLLDLTGWLRRHHGERALVLIDEYDTPIHTGFVHGYRAEAVAFFRSFLNEGLKDNPGLFKGVMTGILRVAKEGLFSELNHVQVFTVLDDRFGNAFGFTEPEVEGLRDTVQSPHAIGSLRAWYDGYTFGRHVLFNPWSVLSALSNPEGPLRPFWVATGGTDVLAELLRHADEGLLADLGRWLSGEEVERLVPDSVLLGQGRYDPEDVLTILLHAGYLTTARASVEGGQWRALLRVPNAEVRSALADAARWWLVREGGGRTAVAAMLDAMLAGDAPAFEDSLSGLIERTLSQLDVGGRTPERVYQAFVAGMLVMLEGTHRVRSEPDAGYGRADVLVCPRQAGRPGAVLEFKRTRSGEDVAAALDAALHQLEARDYARALRAEGADPVWAWAIAFDGRGVRVATAVSGKK